MFGYKKARNNYIVKLEILGKTNENREDIKDPLHAKYRTSKAKVVSITNSFNNEEIDSIKGLYDSSFIYTKGEIVEVKDYDDNLELVCSPGIHYFKTREQAVFWKLDLRNNRYTGEYIGYYENGQVYSKCFYKDGKRVWNFCGLL